MTQRRVLLCGAWDDGPGYPRTRALVDGLSDQGAALAECRLELPWRGRGKQGLLQRPWRWPGFLFRLLAGRRRLRRQLRAAVAAHRPDVIVVPYPGHLVVGEVARSGLPVVLDLFLSAHETAVGDRRLCPPGSLRARLLAGIDRRACRSADLVLMDTADGAASVAALTGVDKARFDWVPVSDPDAPRTPASWRSPSPGEPLQLLFFGTGVPLHGLSVLIEAVRRVPEICLSLVGGTDAERAAAATALGERVRLLPRFVDRAELQTLLDDCHLVAGIFGDSGKAGRVVPFKVVHGLAAGRPVVTADTPAVRRFLTDDDNALLCPPADVEGLAAVLRRAAGNPASLAAIAARSRSTYDRHFAIEVIGARLATLIDTVVEGR